MNHNPSTSSRQEMCELCLNQQRTYTCPRCGIGYCSSDCYKSEAHLECSESFYQQCVIDELKLRENDPEDRKKMLDILKRLHEADLQDNILEEEDDDSEPLDSDDDQNVLGLDKRIENINLDNADEIWSVLTDAEKQEFQALVKNGEVEKLLPKWVPWWIRCGKKKLVKEFDLEEDDTDYVKECPTLIEVPEFNELSKASPNVRYNLLNVLHAYVYTALYFNGDCLNCAKDAASTFLDLCANMKSNKVFNDFETAMGSVIQSVLNTKYLPQDEEIMKALQEGVTCITQGPDIGNSIYISAALSELHRLFSTVKKELSKKQDNENTNDQRFSCKFNKDNVCEKRFTKQEINLKLKKLEYYLSWVKKYGTNVMTEINK